MNKVLSFTLVLFCSVPALAESYFAELDKDGVVVRTVVVNDADAPNETAGILFCQKLFSGTWVQTFQDGRRKNYAGKGYKFDYNLNAFIPPKLFPSWELDSTTARYKAPIAVPEDGKFYGWDENSKTWIERKTK